MSQFSTLCLDFDVSIPATSEYGRVIKVIQLLSTRRDPRTVKLAIIWLDTKGFGDKSMQWLVGMILRETRSTCQ
ncbi:MAG TPA: hypothetical protein VH186_03125 [Chloroflexia bacterium]|nr:hypothetical protein [Chloroflexia bacterium]